MPVAITVEGANILTRSLIIFGQGAVRCHPFVLKEMEAAQDSDFERALHDFDRHLFGHIGYAISNAARSFWLALTHARYSNVPVSGPTSALLPAHQSLQRGFRAVRRRRHADAGRRAEAPGACCPHAWATCSARCTWRAWCSSTYENQGRHAADLPLVEWSCRTLLYQAQEQLHGFLRNLPNRWVALGAAHADLPARPQYSAPADELGQEIVALITHPTETRERLCAGIYATDEPGSPLGALQRALEQAEALVPLEQRLRDAIRSGLINAEHPLEQIEAAEQQGIINASEADQLRRYDALVMEIIGCG